MVENSKTRSGIKPDENEIPYSITTSQVETYLQQKVNVLCESAKMEKINIKVYTTEPGKYFCPFIVVLPTSVLEDVNNSSEEEAPSIFNPNKSSQKLRLKHEFFNFFKNYIYTEDDAKAFDSSDWRNRTGVRSDAAGVLKHLRRPSLNKYDGGVNVVIFMLDPLKVFHDMLKYKDDNRKYRIIIKTIKKHRSGEFQYGIRRRLAGTEKNKKYKDVVINEINKKLRGGRNY